MNMTDDEKLEYLLKAGGKHCALRSGAAGRPAFGAYNYNQQGLMDRKDHGESGPVSVYEAGDLVKITMPDEGMYPNLWTGDELTIAFREEVREGDLAAVSISGISMPVTVREVSYDRDNVWLIPGNEVFPIDCCSPEKVMILGKVIFAKRHVVPLANEIAAR